MSKEVFINTTVGRGPFPREDRRSSDSRRSYLLVAILFITLLFLAMYLIFRGIAFFSPGYGSLDRLFAFVLLCAELFMATHTIGYTASVIKSFRGYKIMGSDIFSVSSTAITAVVVASYNEDPKILEETLASVSTLDYSAKTLYLLDDSTNEKLRSAIEHLAARYNFTYVHRDSRHGYKAGAINDFLKNIDAKYLAVFDADQKPVPDFLTHTISLLEGNSKLAFIQTPQYYHNTKENAVAAGAAYQQAVFYEYICEGKSVSNSLFSCGSNIVYRVEALRSVDGFDEQSVTEDFATGLRMHIKGWKSLYYNHVSVYGLGPESMPGYFKQQMRWALGTIGILKKLLRYLGTNPRMLSAGQWWEYLLSGSYYFIGWVNFLLMICPIVFLLGNVRPLIANPVYYAAAFVPYFVFSMSTFYFSMGRRGYNVKNLIVGQALAFNAFWILMNAAVMALLNVKRPFGVTPKGVQEKLPLKYMFPYMFMAYLTVAAIAVGVKKVVANFDGAVIVNIVWALYHLFYLGTFLYFNKSYEGYSSERVFVKSDE